MTRQHTMDQETLGSFSAMTARLPRPNETPAQDSRRLRALQLTQDQKWSAAAEAWQQLASEAPEAFEPALRLAEALCFAGRLNEAAAATRRAAAARGGDARPLLLLGRIHAGRQEHTLARDAWEAAIRRDPQCHEAWARLAAARFQGGEMAAGFAALHRALTLRPGHPFGISLAARALLCLDPGGRKQWLAATLDAVDDAGAIALLQTMLESAPADETLRLELGPRLLAANQEVAAVETLRPLVADALPGAEAHRWYARALHRCRRWTEAEASWRLVLEGSKPEREAPFRLGQALRMQGRCAAALPYYESAVRQGDGDPAILEDYTRCLIDLGRGDEAAPAWETALAARPADAALQMAWGASLLVLEKPTAARSVLEPLLQGPVRYDALSLLLLKALQAEGDQDAIITRFMPLAARPPADGTDPVAVEILVRYATVLNAAGRSAAAAETLLKLLRGAPENSVVLQRTLRLLLDQGDRATALATARQAIAARSDSIPVWRDVLSAFSTDDLAEDAAALFAEASARFADRPSDWLELAFAAGWGRFSAAVRAALAKIAFKTAEDRIRASDLAVRHGALQRALKLLADDVPEEERAPRIARIKHLRMLLGGCPDSKVKFPDALYGLLCERAARRAVRHDWDGGPVVLVNSALAAGGAEKQIALTLRGLAARKLGRELYLVCTRLTANPRRRVHLADIQEAGVQVIDLQQDPANATVAGEFDDAERLILDLLGPELSGDIRRLHALFCRLRPVCVHPWQDSTAIDGGIAAALAGVPGIVLSTRSTRPTTRRRFRDHMHAAFTALLEVPRIKIANNSAAGAWDYQDWLGLPRGRVAVVHNGFDFDRLDAAASSAQVSALRLKYGLSEGTPVVGGVFRITDVKRPLLWVEVAERIARQRPDVRFVMAGNGPLAPQVAGAAARCGLAGRLITPGHVDVLPWLQIMDLLLLTSRTEGLPNVLIEAQASGVPAVACRVGGVTEGMLEGRTGYSVDGDDPKLLAATVLTALDNPVWLAKAGRAAQKFARERFGLQPMLDGTLALYRLPEPRPVDHRISSSRTMAREHAQKGEWKEAAKAWRQVLRTSPDDADARIGAGEAAFMQMRMGEAHRHFTVAAREPGNPEALRWLARVARAEARHEEALALWQQLLAASPGDLEALLRRPEALAALGDEAGALRAAEDGLAEHPADRRLLRSRARLRLHSGELAGALKDWETLAASDPHDAEASFRAGQTALRLGEGSRAEGYLRAAMAQERCDSRAVTTLARHLAWTGRLAEARHVLRRHWRRLPEDLELARGAFEWLRVAERFAVIDRFLHRAAQRAGRDQAAQVRLADLYAAAERPVTARSILEPLNRKADAGVAIAERLAGLALRAADIDQLRAVADRCVAPALRKEIVASLEYADRLRAETGQQKVGAGFLAWLTKQADGRQAPSYEPRPESVLHVVNSLAAGGTERQCVSLACAQAAEKTQVVVLRTDPGLAGRAAFFLQDLADAGVSTATLEDFAPLTRSLQAALPELVRPPGRLGDALMPRQAIALASAIQALRPEVVMVWSPQCMADAALAAMLTGAPRLILRSGSVALPVRTNTTETEAFRYDQWREVLRTALRRPSGWLLNNCHANLASWLEWLGLSESEMDGRCGVLPNLVDPSALKPAARADVAHLRRRLRIPDTAPVIGGVMRLEQEKGVSLWVATARTLLTKRNDAVFVVVGGGRLEETMRRSVAEAGLAQSFRFIGPLRAGLHAYYSLFDALLLTSWVEGLPNVVIEAQCFGVPVVASNVGGVAEAIAPGLGHDLIAGRTPEPYADALRRALRVRVPRQRRITSGRRFVAERFGHTAVLRRLHQVLKGVG